MRIIRQDTTFVITGFKYLPDTFRYNVLERNDGHGPRTYNVKDKKVPSVTTILSATQSPEKKKSLDAWRARVGYQEAARITQQAATRGTEMHYVLENYIKGVGYLNLSEKGRVARLMAHQIVQGLKELTEIYGTEVTLNYKDVYAGTTDCVGLYKDKICIVDFKQSNKPKREEWIEDYYLQLGAYSLAHNEHYGETKGGIISMCTPKLEYQQFELNEAQLYEYQQKWLERVEKFKAQP